MSSAGLALDNFSGELKMKIQSITYKDLLEIRGIIADIAEHGTVKFSKEKAMILDYRLDQLNQEIGMCLTYDNKEAE